MNGKHVTKAVSILLTGALLFPIASCGKKDTVVTGTGTSASVTASETTEETTAETTSNFVELPSDFSQTATMVPVGDNGFMAPEEGFEITRPDRELYHYDMDLTFDPDNNTVGGHVVFTFYNDSEDAWDKLCLRDHSAMYMDPADIGFEESVETNAAPTEITDITDMREETSLEYTRDEDVSVIWVDLEEPLEPCERMALEYDFVATIPTAADRDGVANGVYNVTYYYPILSEYRNGEWAHSPYYINGDCNYSEVSDYDVRITAPTGYTIVSTGTEIDREEDGDLTTFTYYAPFVRDFVFCASENFVVEETDWEDVHINVVYSADNERISDDQVELALRASAESLQAFSVLFGRYPYEELDVVLAPIFAGGMEYPNLVIINDLMVDPIDQGHSWNYESIIVHEIGHQWFFGIVGSDNYNEPWLDETITSYSEWMFMEYYSDEFGDLDSHYLALDITSQYYSSSFPLNRSYYEFDERTYTSDVYLVGRMAIRDIALVIGPDAFAAVLREYVRRNAFTNATEEDFFEVLYECCGTDNEELNTLIDAFFDR